MVRPASEGVRARLAKAAARRHVPALARRKADAGGFAQ
jgi:hypothetical protein